MTSFLITFLTALSITITPRISFANGGYSTIVIKATVEPAIDNEELTVGIIRCADRYDELGSPAEPDDQDCDPDNPFTYLRASSTQLSSSSPRHFYYEFKLPAGYYRAFSTIRKTPDHRVSSLTRSSFRILEAVP